MTRIAADSLLGDNEILIAEDLVTREEKSALLAWIEAEHARGALVPNPMDALLFSSLFYSAEGDLTSFSRSDEPDLIWNPKHGEIHPAALPAVFWAIRARVVARLGLDGLDEDPYKGSFLTYLLPGGRVHEHRDRRIELDGRGVSVLRCNVLLERPEGGGMPVIGGQELDVPERGAWAFYPTELVHAATPVSGDRHRVTLSFGFLVHPHEFSARHFRVSRTDVWGESAFATHGAVGVLIEAIRSQCDWFSVRNVADAAGQSPALAADVLRELQRQRIVESASCTHRHGVRVFVV